MKKRTMLVSMLSCCLAMPIGASGASTSPFIDIGGSFAEESISSLYHQGIISGKTSDSFVPHEMMTREHFSLLLAKSIGLQPIHPSTPSFTDLPSDAAGYGYVEALHQRQCIQGMEQGLFGSHHPITRQDVAVMLYQVSGEDTGSYSALTYRDRDQVSLYATQAVQYVTSKGLMQGYDGLFQPKKPLTRAEAAVIAHKMRDQFQQKASSYYPEGLPRELSLKTGEARTIPLKLPDPAPTLVWALDNPALGSLSKDGVFTAKQAGQGVLTLNIGLNTYRISITVSNPEKGEN